MKRTGNKVEQRRGEDLLYHVTKLEIACMLLYLL